MKQRISILLLISVAAITIGVFSAPVMAQDASAALDEGRLNSIKQNCIAAQGMLQRIQRSDVVARTNRGRSYESILQLMAALNSRIALHKMSEPRMNEITNELQAQFSSFYNHYTSYENSLEDVLKTKCTSEPQNYYDNLTETRTERDKLNQDVIKMQQLIDEYEQLVGQLKTKVTDQNKEGE